MPDIIDEISKIKSAEKERDKIVSAANKKAEEIVNAAKSELGGRLEEVENRRNDMTKKLEDSYGKTYSLMLNKLEKDYKKTADGISKMDTGALSERISKDILAGLKDYGLPSSTKA